MYAGTLDLLVWSDGRFLPVIKLFSNCGLHYSIIINMYIVIPFFTKPFLSSAFGLVHLVAPRFT